MTLSRTKHQHYISQAEQKLNAIDASSPTWIYRFDLMDREAPLPLRPARRTGIRGSLQHTDLFSFDVVNETYRANLESRFGEYEQNVAQLSESLLVKVVGKDADLKAEVVDLFAAKLVNFARNPHLRRQDAQHVR